MTTNRCLYRALNAVNVKDGNSNLPLPTSQVLIEIHPPVEEFGDFERVRFLTQDQEI